MDNLRLVAHIAKKYSSEEELEDLISIGTIGLIKAVETFDPQKNSRLAAYAARCIDNELCERGGVVAVVDNVRPGQRGAVLVLEMVVGEVTAGIRKGSHGFQSRIDTLYRIEGRLGHSPLEAEVDGDGLPIELRPRTPCKIKHSRDPIP